MGRFLITPVWQETAEADYEFTIKLDPRLAFGSGNHATTKKCLDSLCRIYQEDQPRRVLDLGCGSGILSIASAKLGAETILAVDNGVQDKIQVVEGDALEYLSLKADLILANIYYSVIKELIRSPHFKGKRWYVISGLLGTEAHKIINKLQDLSISIIKVSNENLWFTILGRG